MCPTLGLKVVWLGKGNLCSVTGTGTVTDSGVAAGMGRHWAPVSPTAILAGFGSRNMASLLGNGGRWLETVPCRCAGSLWDAAAGEKARFGLHSCYRSETIVLYL